jgi:hypothetical protein
MEKSVKGTNKFMSSMWFYIFFFRTLSAFCIHLVYHGTSRIFLSIMYFEQFDRSYRISSNDIEYNSVLAIAS